MRKRPLVVEPAPVAEWDATATLDRQIAQARREMGEAKWAELNKEWVNA